MEDLEALCLAYMLWLLLGCLYNGVGKWRDRRMVASKPGIRKLGTV